MSNITINTNQIGTYNLSYSGRDEASNVTVKNRNIYILPNLSQPSIVLKPSPYPNLDKELTSAQKPASLLDYIDRGYIAHDQYGNSSEDFETLKNSVTIEHRRHDNKNDTNGYLIYSETNGSSTIYNVPDGGPITLKVKPQYLYLFKNGSSLPFYNPNGLWEPSDDDYQTVYFSIKYILNIPGYDPLSVTRKVYITDITAPIINLASVSNPENIQAGSNFTDNATFTTLENYWYFDNETIPATYSSGITYPDDNNPIGSIVIRDPNGQDKTSIDTLIIGTWKIYYQFYCTYTATDINGTQINGANFVPNPNITPTLTGATSDPISRSYTIERQVVVTDTIPPTVELKQIGNGESSPITFGSNNSGKLYTSDDNTHGSNYNLYFWIPLNSSTKPSLQDILPNIYVVGEYNSSIIPSGDAEIVIRDNAGSQQNFSVNVLIVTPSNITIPLGTSTPLILRSSIGTDFNDNYDYNYFPIAGTVSNPAEYTIVYTVNDAQNNTTTISRKLLIIDRSIPEISFNTFPSPVSAFSTSVGNGIIYNKYSYTFGQAANTKLTFAADVTETTYTDEFGDIVVKNISHQSPNLFIQSYPKNKPQNVFLLSYSNGDYYLKTFYNQDIRIADSPVLFSVKLIENSIDTTVNHYPIYYFDTSHISMTNRPPIRIVPSGQWGQGVTDTFTQTSQYNPYGTYHSFIRCNFTEANLDGVSYDGFLFIEEFTNNSWGPVGNIKGSEGDIILKTYDPNATINEDGGGFILK